MQSRDVIDERLDRVARQPFRAKFSLRGRERALVELRGMEAVRAHAFEIVDKRLAAALPHKDGRQTPYRGHPVSSPSTPRRPAAARASSAPTGSPAAPS